MGGRGRPRRRPKLRTGANGAANDRGRDGRTAQVPDLLELSPFSVFCALHLGITETDGYAPQSLEAVASRFELSPEGLRAFLETHRLRDPDLRAANFDLASARLDIQVAPEGISRTELARTLFDDLMQSLPGLAPQNPEAGDAEPADD